MNEATFTAFTKSPMFATVQLNNNITSPMLAIDAQSSNVRYSNESVNSQKPWLVSAGMPKRVKRKPCQRD